MADKYYVYRPVLDLLGLSEGTDKGRGYNETLSYGAFTGGPVDLTGMTLDEIDALQTKMLKHPKNKLRSSAVGRYQIVRTTLRSIRDGLNLLGSMDFTRENQDRFGCYLLGVRGIDKWLSGRMSQDTLINNLAREWASLPTTEGKGYYSDQNASVTLTQVRNALAAVKTRHEAQQAQPVPPVSPVEEPKYNWFITLLIKLFGRK